MEPARSAGTLKRVEKVNTVCQRCSCAFARSSSLFAAFSSACNRRASPPNDSFSDEGSALASAGPRSLATRPTAPTKPRSRRPARMRRMRRMLSPRCTYVPFRFLISDLFHIRLRPHTLYGRFPQGSGGQWLCQLCPRPVSASTTLLLGERNVADQHASIYRFCHVIDGDETHSDGGQCFHLDPGLSDRSRRRLGAHAGKGWVECEHDLN